MKKFLAIIAIASLAVACNSKGEKKATDIIDSTANAAKDSIGVVVDSATKTIDSTAKAAVDTIKAKM
jgi:uncharacterized protein YcfL